MWQLFPGFGYTFNGFYDPNAPLNVYFIWYDRFVTISVLIVVFICYVAILLKGHGQIGAGANVVLNRNETMRREKRERNLALQFGIIVLLFILYETCTQFLAFALCSYNVQKGLQANEE
jgi:preprotein translocase subunit SecG